MIKADYRAIDLGGEQWSRTVELFAKLFGQGDSAGTGTATPGVEIRKGATLLVLREGERCI